MNILNYNKNNIIYNTNNYIKSCKNIYNTNYLGRGKDLRELGHETRPIRFGSCIESKEVGGWVRGRTQGGWAWVVSGLKRVGLGACLDSKGLGFGSYLDPRGLGP